MNRKEVCALIREHELGEEVKNRFGDNYTRVPTKSLMQLLWDYDCISVDDYPYDDKENLQAKTQEKAIMTEEKMIEKEVKDTPETSYATEVDNPYEAACYAFVGILKDNGLLDEILKKL